MTSGGDTDPNDENNDAVANDDTARLLREDAAVGATVDGVVSFETSLQRERCSTLRLIGINAFFFAYGAWISSFAIVTLPAESTLFFPNSDTVALAGFMMIAGASQLSGPWAGFVSDRTQSKFGRRRPIILKSATFVAPSMIAMFFARTFSNAWWAAGTYYVAFTAAMLALNVCYTACTGLVPDIISDNQTGQANGILAAMSAAGACASFLYTMVYPNVGSLYWFYLALLATVPVTCLSADEKSTLVHRNAGDDAPLQTTFSWLELASMYTISPSKESEKSFFWLFVCRTLYYTGISAQVFLQYLLRDTAVKDDGTGLIGHEPEQTVARLSFIGQVAGMVCAYPAGLMSDVLGRKPVIAGACAGIISVYIMFIFIHKMSSIYMVGIWYGAMNGMFLSVDYALAIDCLPDRAQSARWLAIWGVASFIGTSVGPLVYSLILHFADREYDEDDGSKETVQEGYTTMLLVGAFLMALCAFGLLLVKPRR